MALSLKNFSARCVEIARKRGFFTEHASDRLLLYAISVHWRKLLESTDYISDNPGPWNEKEEELAEIIVSAIMCLKRFGRKNICIEQLLRDTVERLSEQNK